MRGVRGPSWGFACRDWDISQTRRGPDARSVLAMGARTRLPPPRVLGGMRMQGRSWGHVTRAGSSGQLLSSSSGKYHTWTASAPKRPSARTQGDPI